MKKNMLKNRKKKGFTLIELIAVIAILGILIAVAVPRMTSYTESAKFSKTMANVKTLITAIEVYNSTAQSVPVADGTDVAEMIAGYADADEELDGDANAKQSLSDTAESVRDAETLIDDDTTYAQLKAAMADGVDTYDEIKGAL